LRAEHPSIGPSGELCRDCFVLGHDQALRVGVLLVVAAVLAGRVLVAQTERGVSAVYLGDRDSELIAALRIIKYDQVSAILLTILMCVIVVDGIGARLRRRLK